jgi:hypothetical protein
MLKISIINWISQINIFVNYTCIYISLIKNHVHERNWPNTMKAILILNTKNCVLGFFFSKFFLITNVLSIKHLMIHDQSISRMTFSQSSVPSTCFILSNYPSSITFLSSAVHSGHLASCLYIHYMCMWLMPCPSLDNFLH